MTTKLKKEAEALGLKVDARWSDDTLREKIDQAKLDANHEPAKTKATANRDGMETEADRVAADKNKDGRTNPVDHVKNTKPGPGNPDQRVRDPKTLEGDEFERGYAVAGPAKSDEGKTLKTQETPKVRHETVSASGFREITNNVIPDMSVRKPLIVQAERYGIYVDPKWSDDRIRGELQMALEGRADLQVKGAVPPAAMGKQGYDPATEKVKTPVRLRRDYWDDDGVRVRAGQEVRMDRDKAKSLIDSGGAERTDPLP